MALGKKRLTVKSPTNGAAPPYRRIKQHVTPLILSGQLASGDRVPSENELAATFQVVRLTAHRALRELAREGLLQCVHGLGTFVSAQRETAPASTIYNIADVVRSEGKGALREAIERWTGGRSVAAVVAALEAAGVTVAPIRDLSEALAGDHARHRKLLHEAPHPNGGTIPVMPQPVRLGDGPT